MVLLGGEGWERGSARALRLRGEHNCKSSCVCALGTNVTLGSTSGAWQHWVSPEAWGFAWHGSHSTLELQLQCPGLCQSQAERCHTGWDLENGTDTLLLPFTALAQLLHPIKGFVSVSSTPNAPRAPGGGW